MAATAACFRLGTCENDGGAGELSRRRIHDALVGVSVESHSGSEPLTTCVETILEYEVYARQTMELEEQSRTDGMKAQRKIEMRSVYL